MSGMFGRARQDWAGGIIDFGADAIDAFLVDLTDFAEVITAATNASPIVVTSAAHGYSDGQFVTISGALGNTATNGRWVVTNSDTNTFELYDVFGVASSGNGVWTSGGLIVNLDQLDFLNDIAAGSRIAQFSDLLSKTATLGLLDFADFTFTSVTGDESEAVVFVRDTGTETTSQLLWIDDGATNLPVTPNGGDITYQVNAAGAIRI